MSIDVTADDSAGAIRSALGGRLLELRQRSGKTLCEAAEPAGLSPAFVSLVERGQTEIEPGASLESLAHAGEEFLHDMRRRVTVTSTTDVERLPAAYYQMLFAPVPEPGFNDEPELRERWGASWGSHDEVGARRVALIRPPGAEFEQIDARHYDPRVDALADPDGGWYWTGDRAPDLERLAGQAQRDDGGLRPKAIAALQRRGGRCDPDPLRRGPPPRRWHPLLDDGTAARARMTRARFVSHPTGGHTDVG